MWMDKQEDQFTYLKNKDYSRKIFEIFFFCFNSLFFFSETQSGWIFLINETDNKKVMMLANDMA